MGPRTMDRGGKAESRKRKSNIHIAACYPSNKFCGPTQGEMKMECLHGWPPAELAWTTGATAGNNHPSE
jgi:hypothetical protein